MSHPIREAVRLLNVEKNVLQHTIDMLEGLQETQEPETAPTPMPTSGRNGHLTVAQASRRLKVSNARIYQLIADETLEASKQDGTWMIDAASVGRRVALSL